MQSARKSKQIMLYHRQLACISVVLVTLGSLHAEDAVIYGTTPATALSSKSIVAGTRALSAQVATSASPTSTDVPSVTINDKPVTQVVLNETPEAATRPPSNYPWKRNIVTTTFWIGQDATSYNDTTNYQSAWDNNWSASFGGTDNPTERFGFLPKCRFAVTQNPFYVALPFNDVKCPDLARRYVPWYNKEFARDHAYVSQCKGHWLEIRNKDGKSCYAQWQDVGPFRYDHASYVFGSDRPSTYTKAGLDVSPAVKTHLELVGLDSCDWRFVEAWEVPNGPWITYGEQAIVFAAIKQREAQSKSESSRSTSSTTRVSVAGARTLAE